MQAARLIPYANLALNRFAPVRSVAAHASEIEVLQEAEEEEVTPPAALPGALEKVVAVHPLSTLEQQLTFATQRKVVHQPVLRYELRNALISPDGYWVSGFSERYAPGIYRDALRRGLTRRAEVHHCASPVIHRYFGHWLMDGLPMTRLAPPDGEVWLRAGPGWSHAPRYLALAGATPLDDEMVFTERLHVYQDFAQGSSKKARYAELRRRIRGRLPRRDGPRRVYLRRGDSGVLRRIVNETALEEGLAAQGFRIVDVPGASVDEILEATLDAEIVVGIEGSHLSHAHYVMAEGGVLLALTEPDRFTLWHVGLCRAIGTRMAFCMLEGRAQQGYRADLDDILRTLDLTGAG